MSPTPDRQTVDINYSASGTVTPDSSNYSVKIQPETETVLSVTGMTCASCVNSIEGHIGSFDGAISISVDLMTAQATVRHYTHALPVADLCTAIEDMGYDVAVLSTKTLAP
ncbi:ATPase Cu transporting protein 7B, partial [Linderina pennispora]